MKFTGEVKVWLTNSWTSYEDLVKLHAEGEVDALASRFSYTNHDMSSADGWSLVGTATVEVTLKSRSEIVEAKVDALKTEIQLTKAKAQQHVEQLEEKIQSLLALPNLPTEGDLNGD